MRSQSIYKFVNSESPEYLNEIYFPTKPSNINARSSFQWLKQPLRKSNKGLNSATQQSIVMEQTSNWI